MGCAKTLAGLFAVLLLAPAIVLGTNPDPLEDFCVANLDGKHYNKNDFYKCEALSMKGHTCKPVVSAGDDFLFTNNLARGGNTSTPNGSAVTELDVAEFPGLNTLGASMNRVDFAPGGTNPPHVHPRATEIGYVTRGELLVGIIGSLDIGNRLYSRVLRAGETFVIPSGLMHFQFNVGNTEATMVVSFNSQNPGIVFVPLTLFGSDPPIPTPVLAKALRVDGAVVDLLKTKFAGGF